MIVEIMDPGCLQFSWCSSLIDWWRDGLEGEF